MADLMRLVLHQPDQAGNVGTILRLVACLGVGIDVVEPCGFAWSDRTLRRAGLDYAERAEVRRHADWHSFRSAATGRIVLLTTAGDVRLPDAIFRPDDLLLLGSESAGVPVHVHRAAALRIRIPQVAGNRSLNIAVAAGIALGEALRQTRRWPQ